MPQEDSIAKLRTTGINHDLSEHNCSLKPIYVTSENRFFSVISFAFSFRRIYFCFIGYTTQSNLWIQCNPYQTTCLLRNLYAGQEATVRTRYGTIDCFKIGKGVCQGSILSPCLCLYAEYIMWNARPNEAQAGIKISRKNSIISDMQMILPKL